MKECIAEGISSVMNHKLRTEPIENYKGILSEPYYKKQEVLDNFTSNDKIKEVIKNNVRPDIWHRNVIIKEIFRELELEDGKN